MHDQQVQLPPLERCKIHFQNFKYEDDIKLQIKLIRQYLVFLIYPIKSYRGSQISRDLSFELHK
jgi:hypothetical protein